jgi:hypothetical protein
MANPLRGRSTEMNSNDEARSASMSYRDVLDIHPLFGLSENSYVSTGIINVTSDAGLTSKMR